MSRPMVIGDKAGESLSCVASPEEFEPRSAFLLASSAAIPDQTFPAKPAY